MVKQTARIENWVKIKGYLGGEFLEGKVLDHPKQANFDYWDWQHTSRLASIDEEKGIAETLNTIYTLGKKRE